MDIDVKNALDKVKIICSGADCGEHGKTWDTFIHDVYAFINRISVNNGTERFEYFSKVYLGGKNDICETVFSEIPESLKYFLSISGDKPGGSDYARIVASFFAVLGKYYMSGALDRKDTDAESICESLKCISSYISENETVKRTERAEKQSTEKRPAEASAPAAGVEEEKKPCENADPDTEETLEELLDRLNSLIGLGEVKKEVNQIINLIKVRKKGEEFGAKLPPLSLHLVFYGNPGTGKTTVARLLAKIYKKLGVLSGGQLVEVDRSGLVAGYVGQTAAKTQEVIDRAMGGILFIDEAYSLTHGKGETDFGQEAVDTILKAMEDHRDDFIVIVAGYPDLMKEFIASNPGLKSRFNQFINFEDYTPDELVQIFMLQCGSQNFILEDGCGEYLKSYFERLYNGRTADYANGRDVRNYFEKVIKARANRLAENLENITYEEYMTVSVSDITEAAEMKNQF